MIVGRLTLEILIPKLFANINDYEIHKPMGTFGAGSTRPWSPLYYGKILCP